MPKSVITPFNWLTDPYPAELVGAVAVFLHEDQAIGHALVGVITYIGSSVFHCTKGVQRQYDLDGWHKTGPYIRAMSDRSKTASMLEVSHVYVPQQTGGLTLPDLAVKALTGLPRVWPQVWANAHYNDPNVNKGTTMGATKSSNSSDDDLVAMLTGAAGAKTAGSTPASDPPEPTPRVAEGDPTNAALPPHRRSVIRNLRKPEDYIASLVK